MITAPADPGAIDLEPYKKVIARRESIDFIAVELTISSVKELIAAVEALRARVAKLDHNIKVLRSSLTIETETHYEQRVRAEAAEARVVELAGVLKEWDTPGNHRDNKWWPRWEASRRAALTATPVEALERAEIMKKLPSLLKRAGNLVPMGTVEIERSEEDELVCTIDSVLTKLDALGKEEI